MARSRSAKRYKDMRDSEKVFYLFFDWIDDLDHLDGADAWKIVKAIAEYYRNGTNPLDNVDGPLRVIVSIMFHQIKRKEQISEMRSEFGKRGGFATAKVNKAIAKPQQKSATDNSIQYTDNIYSPLYERESNMRARTHTRTPSPDKNAYGEFKNVYLTDIEHEELKKQFGDRADELIENFSQKLKSKGYKYDDHYVTIRLWEIKDSGNLPNVANSTSEKDQEIDEWFAAKLEQTLNTQQEE